MAGWRNCYASATLIDEVEDRWPDRSKASDGTIGDAAHQTTMSEHNPNAKGVVRARDITAAGIDAPWLADYLRKLGLSGDSRLTGGGYIIFNRRISTRDFSGWASYGGINPHIKHLHVSFSADPVGYDSTSPWGLWPIHGPAPTLPVLRYGDRSHAVLVLQQFLTGNFPGYAAFTPTGFYGDQTKAAVREFQRRAGVHGAPLDGSICGPATNYALARFGYRG